MSPSDGALSRLEQMLEAQVLDPLFIIMLYHDLHQVSEVMLLNIMLYTTGFRVVLCIVLFRPVYVYAPHPHVKF